MHLRLLLVTALISTLLTSVCQAATSKLWEFHTSHPIRSSPALGPDGTIYISSDDRFYAVNPNGTAKWNLDISMRDSSATVSSDGTIYALTKNRIFAVRPDGTVAWSYGFGELRFSGEPAIAADGNAIAQADTLGIWNDASNMYEPEGKLFQFTAAGQIKWRLKFNNRFTSSPAVGQNTIYSGVGSERLFGFNTDTGEQRWSLKLGKDPISSPAVAGDGTIFVIDPDQRLNAIAPNGTVKWQFHLDRDSQASPSIGPDGTIYIGTDEGRFLAIEPTGVKRWEFDASGAIRSSAAIAEDGTIYFGCDDGKLYAIGSSGALTWSFQTADYIRSSPTIAPNGTIYVGSADGKLYALRGHSPLAQSPWPKYRGGARQTGSLFEAGIPKPKIKSMQRLVNGAVELVISNPSGQPIRIETSVDLLTWSLLPMRALPQLEIRYQHVTSQTSAGGFYRVSVAR
jgi:outer membrane protein assembly factor BamB